MGVADPEQLRGCMIDGFGEFDEADYRRSWLFFSNVEYILPVASAGPLFFPHRLERDIRFDVLRVPRLQAELDELVETARRDSETSWFLESVASATDAQKAYAQLVVVSDDELKTEVGARARADAHFALSYLMNKLLAACWQRGLVPIVGQRYAAELLGRKVAASQDASLGRTSVMTPRQSLSFAPFAAGLSLRFLPDNDLLRVPFEKLVQFKDANRRLLEEHQLDLLGVTQSFAGMPNDSLFAERLAALRTEAWKTRTRLDAVAREAWLSSGFKVSEQVITAAAAGFFSGLALLHGHSLHQVAAAAAPAAAAAIGVAATNWVGVFKRCREAQQVPISYVFRAHDMLSPGS